MKDELKWKDKEKKKKKRREQKYLWWKGIPKTKKRKETSRKKNEEKEMGDKSEIEKEQVFCFFRVCEENKNKHYQDDNDMGQGTAWKTTPFCISLKKNGPAYYLPWTHTHTYIYCWTTDRPQPQSLSIITHPNSFFKDSI